MNYSTLPQPLTNMTEAKVDAEMTRTSLYEALQGVADPRRGAGKRYPLAVLLCLLCLAKMAGQTSLKGATEWVRLRAEPLAAFFGLKRTTMPCQMTYKRNVDALNEQELNERLSAFFTRRARATTLCRRTQSLANRVGASGARACRD